MAIHNIQHRGEDMAKKFRCRIMRPSGTGEVKRRKVTGHHKPMARTDREALCRWLEYKARNR
jgi:hypothetical protein